MLSKRTLVGIRLSFQTLAMLFFMLVGVSAYAADPAVANTDEAIAAVDKVLLKITDIVHDMGANGVPIKLTKDVYDCLKKRLDTKLKHLYGVARTSAKRVHAD